MRLINIKNYKILSFIILILVLFVTSISYSVCQNKIFGASKVAFEYIETAYSNIQRITKLELEDMQDNYLIVKTDNIVKDLLKPNELTKYFPKHSELENIILTFVEDWKIFNSSIEEYRVNHARDTLFFISESVYDNSIITLSLINNYINTIEMKINYSNILINSLSLSFILLLIKMLVNANNELKLSKELSNDIHLDISSGLYNREKCQEVLRDPNSINEEYQRDRAIFTITLDSFKNLSKKDKKKFGNEHIVSFATLLKTGTKIFPYEIFVGRYATYEFIVFFDSATQKDIDIYIKEINSLINNFNQEQPKSFQISCSIKYAITTTHNRNIAVRELFYFAQKNMYENEIII